MFSNIMLNTVAHRAVAMLESWGLLSHNARDQFIVLHFRQAFDKCKVKKFIFFIFSVYIAIFLSLIHLRSVPWPCKEKICLPCLSSY